jgi:hypothetical protein
VKRIIESVHRRKTRMWAGEQRRMIDMLPGFAGGERSRAVHRSAHQRRALDASHFESAAGHRAYYEEIECFDSEWLQKKDMLHTITL